MAVLTNITRCLIDATLSFFNILMVVIEWIHDCDAIISFPVFFTGCSDW